MKLQPLVKSYLPVILFYLVIAIVFTYPLILNFSSHIPGGEEDAPTHVWLLWWFKYSLFDAHINPIFTDYIYYPQVINRTFDIHTFVNAFISLPFQYLFGLIAASNIVFFLSFVLSGLNSFLLVAYLTKSKLAGLISGTVYAFFPYVLAQAMDNHTNLTTIWFSPLLILFLLKAFEEKKYRYALLAGLVLGLQGLNDLTYGSFNMALSGLVIAYFFIFKFRDVFNLKHLKLLLTFGVSFIIIFSPMFILALYTISKGFKPEVPLYVQSLWSADIYYFLHPAPTNPFLGIFSRTGLVRSVESTLYLGYTTLFLAGVSIYLYKIDFLKKRLLIGLFILISGAFFILSLGPWLHFFGNDTKIPLPFIIYQLLPLIGGIQEPMRFQPLTMLGLATLVGFSVSFILTKIRIRVAGYAFVALTITFILIEYIPTPLPTTDMTIPEVYSQIKADPTDFSVLDIPVGWNTGNFLFGFGPVGTLQFYQSGHEKKIFRGTVARLPIQNVFYYKTIPLLKYIAQPDRVLDKDDTNKELVRKTFTDLKVKYILIHKHFFREGSNKTLGDAELLISEVLGAKKFYDQENIMGYRFDF